MSRKFIPYGRQSIDGADVEAVVQVLLSDFLTQGPAVEKFECGLAEYLGVREVVACANGTAALHLTALGLGIGPGDAWITSPLSFLATANAARYVGATPVFADIDRAGCLDPGEVAGAVERARAMGLTPKVLAGVDYAGQPADWSGLEEAAGEHGLILVDDACHGLGGWWLDKKGNKRYLGDGETAKATVFSFHPVKHLATGEGGAVTTNDPGLAKALRMLRSHGMTKENILQPELGLDQRGGPNPWYYEQKALGYNYRLTDLQAALGSSQLKRLPEFLEKRREIAEYYDEALEETELIRPLERHPNAAHAFHLYPVRIDFPGLGLSRAQVMRTLAEQGIGTQVHYIPIHLQPDYRKHLGTGPGDFPRAEALYEELLSLPMYPGLTPEEQERVIEALLDLG